MPRPRAPLRLAVAVLLALVAGRLHALDAARVPEVLHPLIPLVERWGTKLRGSADDEVYALFALPDGDPRIVELETLSSLWTTQRREAFSAWFDRVGWDHAEAYAFYATISLLVDLALEPDEEHGDRAAALVADLARAEGRHALRDRIWAARHLVDYPADPAMTAPALRRALDDDHPAVRVWAHVALAAIDGEVDAHRDAIAAIVRDHAQALAGASPGVDGALDELARPAAARHAEGLASAARFDDVPAIERVLAATPVDDVAMARALATAIDARSLRAIEALIRHGAKADGDDEPGVPLLHAATRDRRGQAMLRALLAGGADPRRRDGEGRTALDLALERGYARNAEVLRAAMAEGAPAAP